MTHTCVCKLFIIGSGNCLSLGRRRAIIWTHVGRVLIGPLGSNLSEILSEIYAFSFKKMQLNVSSGRWQPFCLDLNLLTIDPCHVIGYTVIACKVQIILICIIGEPFNCKYACTVRLELRDNRRSLHKSTRQIWGIWQLATGPVILLKFDPNHRFSQLGWPWNLMDDLEKFWAHLLYYTKLCASYQILQWIRTEVRVLKRSIRVTIDDFLSHVTLKFDGWPWKTMGHLFYTLSSFVHHLKTMVELKLELQSGNAQFGSKSAIFCPVWPWNLTDDLEKQWGTSSMLLQPLCIIS